jgi:hypothetical protein
MGIKDLLVHLDQTPVAQKRLDAALTLGQRFNAHVIAQPTGRNQNGGAAPRSFLVYADDGKRQQIKKSGTPWRHSYRNTRALSSEYFLVLIG